MPPVKSVIAMLAGAALALVPVAARQEASLNDLPVCGAERLKKSNWQRVTYMGFELLLPSRMRLSKNQFFDHGGRRWEEGTREVSLSLGFFGLTSFRDGEKCRFETDGVPALMISRISKSAVSVSVWIPSLPRVVVTARSSRPEDLPMLRAIASTLKAAILLGLIPSAFLAHVSS